jgi:hypothetical protein
MALQELIAKITANTVNLEGGSGGTPNITAEEINAALGYAQGDIVGRQNQINVRKLFVPLGVLLVQAKYADDRIAKKKLLQRLPIHMFRQWPLHQAPASETISIAQIQKVAALLIEDYLTDKKISVDKMAIACGMDYRTWSRKYSRFYEAQRTELTRKEGAIMIALQNRLFDSYQ